MLMSMQAPRGSSHRKMFDDERARWRQGKAAVSRGPFDDRAPWSQASRAKPETKRARGASQVALKGFERL